MKRVLIVLILIVSLGTVTGCRNSNASREVMRELKTAPTDSFYAAPQEA